VRAPDQRTAAIDPAILRRGAALVPRGSSAGDRTAGRAGGGDAAAAGRAGGAVDRARSRTGAGPALTRTGRVDRAAGGPGAGHDRAIPAVGRGGRLGGEPPARGGWAGAGMAPPGAGAKMAARAASAARSGDAARAGSAQRAKASSVIPLNHAFFISILLKRKHSNPSLAALKGTRKASGGAAPDRVQSRRITEQTLVNRATAFPPAPTISASAWPTLFPRWTIRAVAVSNPSLTGRR
jgi:hypothetical protein